MSTFVWQGSISATWSTGLNWLVGGIAQASPPTTTDDVTFDGSGGGSTTNPVTLTASTTVGSVDFTGYTGVFTHNSGQVLTISGGGASNKLKFVTGMTYTKGSQTTSGITFTPVAGSTCLMTFAGKIPGNAIVNGAADITASVQLQDTVVVPGTVQQTWTVSGGKLDLNNQILNCGVFTLNSGTNTRTLVMGTGTINIIATIGTVLDLSGTGATVSAASGTITGTTAPTGSVTWQFGTSNTIGTFLPAAGSLAQTIAMTTGVTFSNFNPIAGTRILVGGGSVTVSNAFNWVGTPTSPIEFRSSGANAQRTVNFPAGAVGSWVSISDIAGAGNVPVFSDSSNVGNNSGVTINPSTGIPMSRIFLGK